MDRHGNVRVYFWRGPGHKKTRMREPFGTAEFRRHYDALIDAPPIPSTPDRPPVTGSVHGTWRWLCEQYFARSGDFKQLAARTRKVRRQILEATWFEPFVPGEPDTFEMLPISEISPRLIRVLRDRKAGFPESGNGRLKAMRQVFAWAISDEKMETNPGRDVPYFIGSSDGFHTWTVEEVEQFDTRHAVGTKARLAKDLLLFTGARRSDVVLMGPTMIRDGWLRFTEIKGRSRLVKQREIPVLPVLRASIDARPSNHPTFLVTEFGNAFTSNGFGNWFRKRCDDAELKHCSAHGLRKAGATIAAENGATEHQLMAIFGWESPKQAARYTRKANRKKLAGSGMALMSPPKDR